MCFPTKIAYGCGCVVLGGDFCHSSLNLAENPGVALLCGPLTLPLAEIRRVHPCYRLECPKQEAFEPWVCCVCDHGPNIESSQCRFKLYKEPVSSPESGFLLPCDHLLCSNCVPFVELDTSDDGEEDTNVGEKDKSKGKGKGKASQKKNSRRK